MALHEFQNSLEKFVGTMESCHEERKLLLQQLAEVSDEIHAVRAAVFALARSRAAIAAELGDVLWYVSAVANQLGTSLGEVAAANLEKLRSRQARGALTGSGDNR